MTEYTYLGKGLRRTREKDKLTGKSLFTADIHLPRMLWGKILHSPYAHARILRIDTSEAMQLPGVKAVVTAADTPGVRIGRWLHDRTVLAQGEVRYIGEPIAAVAAADPETAEVALELIRVDYEELPAVFDPFRAMEPDAPLVHSDRDEMEPRKYRDRGEGNIILSTVVRHGDVEKGLAESDVVYRERYSTQAVHQGFIEPHAAVAALDSQGKATLWSSTKAPFIVRKMTAKALGIPLSKLRVIAPAIGGDFGGKGTAFIEPIALLLAMRSGAPVKLVLSRREELTCTFVRDASFTELTMGASKDGRFLALKGEIVTDTGAYCDLGGSVEGYLNHLAGAYRIPHVELRGYRVFTNKIPRGNVRAPSAPHPTFAIESHVDGLIGKLAMDPIEVRLINGVQEGDPLTVGREKLTGVGFKPTLVTVADYLKREQGPKEKNRGWGVACGQWGIHKVDTKGGPTSSAWVKINEDGTVVLLTGATDNGGGQQGIFAQMVGEILNVAPDSIVVIASDTDCTPYEQGTGGSRTTYRAGNSIRLAAEDARQKLFRVAAEKLGVSEDALTMEEGSVVVKDNKEKRISLAALATASMTSQQGPIIGVGEKLRAEGLAIQAKAINEVDSCTFSTHAVQVEVDPETGLVKILKYIAAHDVGFAINPDNVRGQIEGGVAFGTGYGMSEELVFEGGTIRNADFLDYKLPTTMTVPAIESALIEVPSRFGPFGAKGIGEPPCIPVAPAIANAVYDAVGVRITDIPLTPEKVYNALHRSDQ